MTNAQQRYVNQLYKGEIEPWNMYFNCLAWTNETRSTKDSHREVVKIILRHTLKG